MGNFQYTNINWYFVLIITGWTLQSKNCFCQICQIMIQYFTKIVYKKTVEKTQK